MKIREIIVKLSDVPPKERPFVRDFIENIKELGWTVLIEILDLNTIDYDRRFSFFSSEVKNLVVEIRSIALDWYKSFISEKEFKRYCLLLEVRDQMKQLSDKEFFSPENLRFLEPLNKILSTKWANFQEMTEDRYLKISSGDYHWYFNEVITILDLIRDNTWTHTYLKENRKVLEIIQGIKGELAKLFQTDNPDLPKTRPYIHVEDLPAHLLPNIILAFRQDSNSLIFETVIYIIIHSCSDFTCNLVGYFSNKRIHATCPSVINSCTGRPIVPSSCFVLRRKS